jgi:kumamolisin
VGEYVRIDGTERKPRTGDRIVGRPDYQKVIQASVHLKPQNDQLGSFVRDLALRSFLSQRQPALSREDYAAQYGASADDIRKVKHFAVAHGLHVVPNHAARKTGSSERAHRTVELRGTLAAFSRAFKINFIRLRGKDGTTYRGYQGHINVPSNLQGVVQNVVGMDNMPQADTRLRLMPMLGGLDTSAARSYTPDQVAKLYNFPSAVTGKGQVVAIVELGGGYRRTDLEKYFQKLGIAMPALKAVSVAGGRNAPTGDPGGPDGEVMLDIEVAAAVAPAARYLVYFAPNTNRGIFKAVNTAIHDNRHKPNIISISWGGPESSWRKADMDSVDQAFQAAAAMGVSVFVAAGDGGASDDVPPGNVAHVDFPAGSPFATACGGTRMVTSSDGQTISSEVVWNDGPQGGGSGGGISGYFPVPTYQSGYTLPTPANPGAGPGRGVPDVAGNADPWSGYNVRVDSENLVIGGTSAVAPLWAGLTALLNEGLQQEGLQQPVGFFNPLLYQQIKANPGTLNNIVSGNNDITGLLQQNYHSGSPYNACTGLGTPNGQAILQIIK